MTINKLVEMAKRIHDAEGVNLGSSSTREYRNAFWARVIGCAHFGHPVYNAEPDPQWHLKKASETSPQSDDVAVSMPSKQFWDCIPGSGSDGYRFEPHGPETLPIPPQIAYKPPVPDGAGGQPQPGNMVPYHGYAGDATWDQFGAVYEADAREAGQSLNAQSFRWAGRTIHDNYMGENPGVPPLSLEASIAKHRKEWRAVMGLPPV